MSDTASTPTPTPAPPTTFWAAIVARAKEPSTWAAVSAGSLTLASQLPPRFQGYAVGLAAAGAALGVVLSERGKRTPAQFLADAIAAAQAVEAQRPTVSTTGPVVVSAPRNSTNS